MKKDLENREITEMLKTDLFGNHTAGQKGKESLKT